MFALVIATAVGQIASSNGLDALYDIDVSDKQESALKLRERRQTGGSGISNCVAWTNGISRCIAEEGSETSGNCAGSCSLFPNSQCDDSSQCGFCEAKACTGIDDASGSASSFLLYLGCEGSCLSLPTQDLIDICRETCACGFCEGGLTLYPPTVEPSAAPTTMPSTRAASDGTAAQETTAPPDVSIQQETTTTNVGVQGSGDRTYTGSKSGKSGKSGKSKSVKTKTMGKGKPKGKKGTNNRLSNRLPFSALDIVLAYCRLLRSCDCLRSVHVFADSVSGTAALAAGCVCMLGAIGIAVARRHRISPYLSTSSEDGYAVPIEEQTSPAVVSIPEVSEQSALLSSEDHIKNMATFEHQTASASQ